MEARELMLTWYHCPWSAQDSDCRDMPSSPLVLWFFVAWVTTTTMSCWCTHRCTYSLFLFPSLYLSLSLLTFFSLSSTALSVCLWATLNCSSRNTTLLWQSSNSTCLAASEAYHIYSGIIKSKLLQLAHITILCTLIIVYFSPATVRPCGWLGS